MSRKDLIKIKAEKIAELLGIESERIARNDRGLILSPDQIDILSAALIDQGVKKAADKLRREAKRVNASGPDHNLSLWAVYLSGAAFLGSRA